MGIGRWLPKRVKLPLKAWLKRCRVAWVERFRSYDRTQLLRGLRSIGIRPGDMLMLHSAFSREQGFRGTVGELIDTFVEAVGPEGHLLMVSLPYRSASLDWLEGGRTLDVRRTPSMMGVVSETFRRREGVLRSAHPTHPILALGPRAAQLLAAHPHCIYPCGPDTPFDELVRADARVVFFNVPMDTFTFFHYLEHRVAPRLPFALYTDKLFDGRVIDAEGQERIVRTYAFAREAIAHRRPERLYDALQRRGSVATLRLGATRILAVRVRDAIACTDEMLARGEWFYDIEGPSPRHSP